MTLPEISTLTDAELQELAVAVSTAISQRAQTAETEKRDTRAAVTTALTDLDALIGDGDPKGTGSLVAVRQFTGDEMAAAAQVALPLAFHGLEILARATRDLARVVGD